MLNFHEFFIDMPVKNPTLLFHPLACLYCDVLSRLLSFEAGLVSAQVFTEIPELLKEQRNVLVVRI